MTLARKLMMAGGAANSVPAVANYINAMTSAPDATREGHITTLIDGLIADGVWAKLDWLSIFAAHDAQAARLNAVDPTQAFSVVGAPSFVADDGYRGTSTTGYLNSNWDPANNGVYFQQNSACMGAWSLTDLNGANTALGNNKTALLPRNANAIYARLNSTNNGVSTTNSDSIGLHAADRYGPLANNNKFKKNGATVTFGYSYASEALSTVDFYGLAWNNSGSPTNVDSTRRYAAMFWGASLSDAEHTAIYNRLSTYLTAVGAI